jgi:hypothetical protein
MIGRLRRNHVVGARVRVRVGPPLIDRLATCRQARYRNKRHRASEDLKLGANSWKHPTAILLDGRSILCSPPPNENDCKRRRRASSNASLSALWPPSTSENSKINYKSTPRRLFRTRLQLSENDCKRRRRAPSNASPSALKPWSI